MKIRLLTILLVSLSLVACQTNPKYVQLANSEVNEFAHEIKVKHNLTMISYGGGYIDCINRIGLTFAGIRNIDVNSTRLLFVDITENFLKKINTNDEIQQYLSEAPFNLKNFSLMITFPPMYHPSQSSLVSIVGMNYFFTSDNPTISYMAFDALTDESTILQTETYQEALQRVRTQQGN